MAYAQPHAKRRGCSRRDAYLFENQTLTKQLKNSPQGSRCKNTPSKARCKNTLSKPQTCTCRSKKENFSNCHFFAISGGHTSVIGVEEDAKTAAAALFPDTDDLVLVKGVFGVAENGCVFLSEPQECQRLDYFIHEALVLVIDAKDIVANMHDAYTRLGETPMPYGIFISGPSKTADIEQALVFGAHGAREVGVLLLKTL